MEEKKLKILKKCKEDLIAFGKVIFPNAMTKPSPIEHYEISDVVLDTSLKYVNIIAPRGIAKTTLVGILLVLHHLMFNKGRKVIVLVSRTQGHSINLLQTIKDILDFSAPFRALFGYWGINSAKKWTSTEIILKDGSAIICKGMGQQMRGLNIGGQRPTLIILDDPEDENNTKTKEAMDNNFRWLLQSAIPSTDQSIGRVVVIGTPLHELCIVMRLKTMNQWKTLHYSYLKDIKSQEYVYTMENRDWDSVESIWEEMKTVQELKSELEDLVIVGKTSAFYKERLCWITGDEEQIFGRDKFCYYKGKLFYKGDMPYLDINYLEDREGAREVNKIVPVNIFMGIDPASSISQHADFSVIFPIAVDNEYNIYCLPYFRQRVKPMELTRQILLYYNKYKPLSTQIETIAYQEMLRDYLLELQQKKGIYIPGLSNSNKPRNSKSSRLESLEPYFTRRKVYLLKDKMIDFEDELVQFPRSKHDDILDAFYYAKLRAYPAQHIWKSKDIKASFIDQVEEDEKDTWVTA